MGLVRYEQNVTTGDASVVDQIAYKNKEGGILVLDAIDPTPEGYEEFDPHEVKPKQ